MVRPAGALAWTGAAVFAASLGYFLYSYFVVFGRGVGGGDWLAPVIANALLFSVFALHHSLLARTPMREFVRRHLPPHLERTLYTWTASLLFIAVCALWRPVPGIVYAATGARWWPGAAVQAAGVAITFRGSAAIDVLDLAGVRQVRTAGEAHSPQHAALETTGVYGIVRHPIYLGWVLLVFGTPTMTATRLTFAAVSTLYLAIAVPWEERSLVEAFGAEYEAYRRRVRWRIVPGIY